MKRRTGMRAFSALFAVLLVSVGVAPVMSAGSTAPDVQNEEIFEENIALIGEKSIVFPDFQPGIIDKLSYEEEIECTKSLPSTPSLPESAIAQIILSKAWFLQNDEDARSEVVQITIPTNWLDKTPVNENESIVLLRIPKRMLELDNINVDPSQITVSYPVDMFKFYSNIDEMKIAEMNREKRILITNDQLSTTSPSVSDPVILKSDVNRAIDRQVRAWHQRNTGYSVVTVTGIIDPTSYSNQGETFRNYNEREIYLNREGDVVEFISDFLDNGNAYVWAAIFDEGSWVTPWNWLQVNVTGTLQPIEYRLYISDGVYDLWLKDTSTETWYHNSYNDSDNPATRVDWLTGSTEVDTVGGISEYFRTETNPIRDDWTYADGNWHRPRATFDWNSYSSDQQYVYINAWWDNLDRINTRHIAGSGY